MITEQQIESIFEYLDRNESTQEKLFIQFSEEQSHISAWILGEQFEILTEAEQDYLYFLALVIWLCYSKYGQKLAEIDGDTIREIEEKNWALLEKETNTNFQNKLNLVFKDTKQEDLLAFVEDALSEDPDDPEQIVSRVGKEPMLVALKSIIDAFDS
jgi:hypothetical protein